MRYNQFDDDIATIRRNMTVQTAEIVRRTGEFMSFGEI